MTRKPEVWILGATGRTGRAIATRLAGGDVALVLVGRDRDRLGVVAASLGDGVRTVLAASTAATAAEITRQRPAVVVNTIGPFTETAVLLARACLPHTDYVDIANELPALRAVLDLDAEAVAAGRTLVTAAAFGVLATEAVVAALCEGRPVPSHVRVDALPAVATEAGPVGASLAATITDGVAAGGRRYEAGRLVRVRPGGGVTHLTLPDGRSVTTAAVPNGELLAARVASGAPEVTATWSMAPTAPVIRAVLPAVSAVFRLSPVRAGARRLLARVVLKAAPQPHENSWGHADVRWADGTRRQGWLRTGDAMHFTVGVAAEVALRLAQGQGTPGAYTPAGAFGPDLASAAGGELLLDR